MRSAELTSDIVRSLLSYDPSTGLLRWKPVRIGRAKSGSVAGSVGRHGYVTIAIYGASYKAHRVIWLWVHGETPPMRIDHINGDGTDNRIENLRLATHAENLSNSRLRKDSSSGLKGVHFQRQTGKFVAYVSHNGKRHHLGSFADPQEAKAARDAKARELHGQFARSN